MTNRYGMTKFITIRKRVNALRRAIRSEGTPAIQNAWDRLEPFVDRVFRMGW